MKASKYLLGTKKEKSSSAVAISHDLSIRAGLVYPVAAGIFDYLPSGQRVLGNIERVIREEMDSSGAQQISMPLVQPSDIWEESGRWDTYKGEMIKFKNREGRDFCLGPTNEETVCHLARAFIQSPKQLPLTLYQIGKKFRDELRPRHGLLRTRDFVMKDAYSFDIDEEGLDVSYRNMRDTYSRIFERLGIEVVPIEADPGEIGGGGSEEFISSAQSGEDRFVIRNGEPTKIERDDELNPGEEALTGIEVAHIFKLGDKYSVPMGLTYNSCGDRKPIVMGCYGIGVSRLIPAIIEQNHDDRGIIWPKEVSPFSYVLIPTSNNPEVVEMTDRIYADLRKQGINALYDERDVRAGVKFGDADLIGIPKKIVLGPKSLEKEVIEVEDRSSRDKEKITLEGLTNYLESQ
ncbi:MAG: proline--tRNA ligase [Nanoarchaeota archaeon]